LGAARHEGQALVLQRHRCRNRRGSGRPPASLDPRPRHSTGRGSTFGRARLNQTIYESATIPCSTPRPKLRAISARGPRAEGCLAPNRCQQAPSCATFRARLFLASLFFLCFKPFPDQPTNGLRARRFVPLVASPLIDVLFEVVWRAESHDRILP
jgi:hypothetical protein